MRQTLRLTLLAGVLALPAAALGPEPGDVYREFPDDKIAPDLLSGAIRCEALYETWREAPLPRGKARLPGARLIRVYYGQTVFPPKGRITAPKTGGAINDKTTIEIAQSEDVVSAEALVYYDGLDEDRDGRYSDWHTLAGRTWDTRWVPDQARGGVKVAARLRRADGLTAITAAVEGLTLERKKGESIKLFAPEGGAIPIRVPLENAREAVLARGSELEPVPVANLKPGPNPFPPGTVLLIRFEKGR